ncbi:HepT-like ribonuclease domain-containing protein [Daejeonella sp.]|uniref:HepT-like ribonuclease domain-containing protein n=1 Tax=Daejeonella sp. TaxID=2805397 RepID=UPI0025C15859|nr:HepT-like ribonuclease domain-containing protein [Daejeonella sp.]
MKIYTKDLSLDEFLKDDKTIDAVIRNFEIIGEAANRIPDSIRDKFPMVNWHRIRGFRNRIVHDYMGIDFEIVWEIIDKDLDVLQRNIEQVRDSI